MENVPCHVRLECAFSMLHHADSFDGSAGILMVQINAVEYASSTYRRFLATFGICSIGAAHVVDVGCVYF